MRNDLKLPVIKELMHRFAMDTGLQGTGKPRRYLWTDAFAVCNFLELHRLTDEDAYRVLALRLVDQVHLVLGRHRDDDPREGWISGLGEDEGAAHPTRGGLRIGKKLPERPPDQPYDDRLEWDRDGQYFHYLTKWMHTLLRVSAATKKAVYATWARELAGTAHRAFSSQTSSGGPKRLCWKMSIDLSRPLVPAMGHHDPLDGYLTYLELQEGTPEILAHEINEMKAFCQGQNWTTDDPLGIGGILCDALRAARLLIGGRQSLAGMPEDLLHAALNGLQEYSAQNPLQYPAEYRLAFRELGLSIGLQALDRISLLVREQPALFSTTEPLVQTLNLLAGYRDLGVRINTFWLAEQNRQAASWTSHADINTVMLATSLAPEGFFG